MFNDKKHDNYYLGTLGFPSTGWWVMHAIAIGGIYYLGYKAGLQEEEDY